MKPLYGILISLMLPGTLAAQSDTADTAALPMPDLSEPGTWAAFAGGGMAIPYSPDNYENSFKPGYSWMAGAGYSLPPGSLGYVELNAFFLYGNTPFDEAGYLAHHGLTTSNTFEASQGDVFLGMVGLRGIFATEKTAIGPYFTLGMGFYHLALPNVYLAGTTTVVEPEYTKSAFGWTAGLGVDVPINERIILFADGKFVLGVTGETGTKQFTVMGGVRVGI